MQLNKCVTSIPEICSENLRSLSVLVAFCSRSSLQWPNTNCDRVARCHIDNKSFVIRWMTIGGC